MDKITKYKYYCEYCNFMDNHKYRMKEHLLTKKHKNISQNDTNIENYNKSVFICNECLKSYKNKLSAYNHVRKYHGKTNEENPIKILHNKKDTKTSKLAYKIATMIGEEELVDYLDQLNESKDALIEELHKTNKIYEKENEYKKTIIDSSKNIIGNSMTMLKYAMTNYKDAPKLLPLDRAMAKELISFESKDGKVIRRFKNDDEIAERMATLQEMNMIPQYIGENIRTKYKTLSPEDQSLWLADASRFKFIIKDDLWNNDNKGVFFSGRVVNPMSTEIIDVMDNFCISRKNEIGNMSRDEEAKYFHVNFQSIRLREDVRLNKTSKETVKYLCPYFALTK